MGIESTNPATGELLQTFKPMTMEETDQLLQAASATFDIWRKLPFAERAIHMRDAARILRAERENFARTMAIEMGKPVSQGEAEIEKCAWACDYYAKEAAVLLADQPRQTEAYRSYIRFEALGPVLAVMPWNFPFWQVFRFAAPALMAGNAGILKHASNVPRCALTIEQIFRDAGFPEGVFRAALINTDAVPAVIADRRIQAVTLTGSDMAGSNVAATAGREIKKTVLELGGSDPFIVMEDADIQKAAKTAADARLVNCGQSCIAAKRFIVVEKVASSFVEMFVSEMRSRKIGDPLDRSTQVGPLARFDLRESLHRQVEGSIHSGAELLLGGRIPEGRGYYYPPTVLDRVDKGMPAFDEETFGPVAAVIHARDDTDAIRLANSSSFGLGASLWTQDRDRAERLARKIDAGCVFVNEMVKSDPRLPFGGVKRSGYGRELSEFGIREFVNIKSVWIA